MLNEGLPNWAAFFFKSFLLERKTEKSSNLDLLVKS